MSSYLDERLDAALKRVVRILKRKSGTKAQARKVCADFSAWARGRAQGDGELVMCMIRGPQADFSRRGSLGKRGARDEEKGGGGGGGGAGGGGSNKTSDERKALRWEGASDKVNAEMARIWSEEGGERGGGGGGEGEEGKATTTTATTKPYPPVDLTKGFLDAAEDGASGASFAMRFAYTYMKGLVDAKETKEAEEGKEKAGEEEDRVFRKDLHAGRRLRLVTWENHKVDSVTNSSFSGQLSWKVVVETDLERAKVEVCREHLP